MTKVSVIIPAYNAAPYIKEAIESIRCQTLTQWELIVVDDGSTDHTSELVRSAMQGDERLQLLHQENQGEAIARANGLRHANGKYIYFFDADDIAYDDALERLCHVLEHNSDAIASYGTFRRISEQGDLLFPNGRVPTGMTSARKNMMSALMERSFLAMGAVMARARDLRHEDLIANTQYAEDWVMWVRLAARGEFVFVGHKPLVKRRLHAMGQTRSALEPEAWMKAVEIVYSDSDITKAIDSSKLVKHRQKREAFVYFSIGCKYYAMKQFEVAKHLFLKSLHHGYGKRPLIWILYGLSCIGWIPRPLKWHLGIKG